jgi:predicted PhzF superfamily epimerase YddE/YHI9
LVNDVEVLRSLNPNWTRLDRMAGVAALLDPAGPADPAVEVRAFFYAGGTREDPVTGSLNGAVAQWLVGNGTLVAPYVSSQGTSMGRDGKVFVSPGEGDALWVGGDAVTGIDGQVEL